MDAILNSVEYFKAIVKKWLFLQEVTVKLLTNSTLFYRTKTKLDVEFSKFSTNY